MRQFLLALLFALLPALAWAGSGTVTVLDSGGTTRTYDVVTDGLGHYVSTFVVCDQSAAAYCASVDSSHNLGVVVGEALPAGTNNIGGAEIIDSGGTNKLGVNISGQAAIQAPPSLPLPSGAATAANQTAVQGTAGTPSTDVVTVQGVSGGTTLPISGTVTTSPPSNASTNITEIGGSALAFGSALSAASVPVVVASDQGAVAVKQATASALNAQVVGTAAAGAAVSGNPVQVAGSDGTDVRSIATNASGQTVVVGAGTAGSAAGGVATIQGVASMTPVQVSQATASNLNATVTPATGTWGGCAGATVANTATAPFSNAASSSNLKIITKSTGKTVYICAIKINPVASAVDVALVSGTKTTNDCDTSTAGLDGGATAATGNIFAANEGETFGNGVGIVAVTASTGQDVCLLFSGAVQVSGTVTYAQY